MNIKLDWNYFRMLGHKDGFFYYEAKSTGHILGLKPGQHTRKNLLSLAPIGYWETIFPSKKGVDWLSAISCIMHECAAQGFYEPTE